MCRSSTDPHDQHTRNGALERFRIMRAQQLRSFAVLKSKGRRFGTTQARQNATVLLIRGVGVPRRMLWHAFGSSNGCLPTRHAPQWK
eukprot:6674343-Pyramimonas_sp.AAC.1